MVRARSSYALCLLHYAKLHVYCGVSACALRVRGLLLPRRRGDESHPLAMTCVGVLCARA
jgi:hypothetical protein